MAKIPMDLGMESACILQQNLCEFHVLLDLTVNRTVTYTMQIFPTRIWKSKVRKVNVTYLCKFRVGAALVDMTQINPTEGDKSAEKSTVQNQNP